MGLKQSARNATRSPVSAIAAFLLSRNLLPGSARERVWSFVSQHYAYEKLANWRPTEWGDEIFCDASDFVQKHIYFFGAWEPQLTQRIHSLPVNDGLFVDIGANIGYFSLLASTRFKRVIAFEASPHIYELLCKNIKRNGRANIDARNVAIGDKAGEIEIYRGPADNLGMTSLKTKAEQSIVERTRIARLSDELSEAELANVSFIKIDVEGAEPEVVDGFIDALPILSKDLEIVVEVNPEFGDRSRQMFEAICEAGFAPFHIASGYSLNDYLSQTSVTEQPCGYPVDKQADIAFRRKR